MINDTVFLMFEMSYLIPFMFDKGEMCNKVIDWVATAYSLTALLHLNGRIQPDKTRNTGAFLKSCSHSGVCVYTVFRHTYGFNLHVKSWLIMFSQTSHKQNM